MIKEIVITVLIFISAVYIIYKNVKRSSSGKCNCSGCSSHCQYYKEKN